jgi:uncharacterized protein YutE (UPF0331/DUF86 family)
MEEISIEYLILIDRNKNICINRDSFINYLKSQTEFSFANNKIVFRTVEINFECELINSDDPQLCIFNVSLKCNVEKIETLENMSRIFEMTVSVVSKNSYLIEDGLTLYYSQKGYPIIHKIENILRKLINKLMFVKNGTNWITDRTPKDVSESIKNRNDDNFLHTIDFTQLSNFLFSENFPNLKQSLINKLKGAKDISDIKLTEVKELIPISNWNKYFNPIIDCEKDYLQKRWIKISTFRNAIAHNRKFRKQDLSALLNLFEDIEPHLKKAINEINKINISDEELIDMLERADLNANPESYEFLSSVHFLNYMLKFVTDDKRVNQTNIEFYSYRLRIKLLRDMQIISEDQFHMMNSVFDLRNKIVHFSYNPPDEIRSKLMYMSGELIVHLKTYINTDLDGE